MAAKFVMELFCFFNRFDLLGVLKFVFIFSLILILLYFSKLDFNAELLCFTVYEKLLGLISGNLSTFLIGV